MEKRVLRCRAIYIRDVYEKKRPRSNATVFRYQIHDDVRTDIRRTIRSTLAQHIHTHAHSDTINENGWLVCDLFDSVVYIFRLRFPMRYATMAEFVLSSRPGSKYGMLFSVIIIVSFLCNDNKQE